MKICFMQSLAVACRYRCVPLYVLVSLVVFARYEKVSLTSVKIHRYTIQTHFFQSNGTTTIFPTLQLNFHFQGRTFGNLQHSFAFECCRTAYILKMNNIDGDITSE